MLYPCPRCGHPESVEDVESLVCDWCAYKFVPLAIWARILKRYVVSRGWFRDQDDLVQEGLVAIWQTDPPPASIGLGIVIAARKMVDWMRATYGRHGYTSRTVKKWASTDTPPPRGDEPLERPGKEDPAGLAIALIMADELGVALGKLKPNERHVILASLDGLTLQDMGAQLGVTESRACQIRQEARDKLLVILKKD